MLFGMVGVFYFVGRRIVFKFIFSVLVILKDCVVFVNKDNV